MASEELAQLVRMLVQELRGSGERVAPSAISADLRGLSLQSGKPVGIGWSEDGQGLPVVLMPIGDQFLFCASGVLGTTTTTVFAAIDPLTDVHVYVVNVDTVVRTYQLCRVASGGSMADTNSLNKAGALGIGLPHHFWGLSLGVGDSIRGLCDSASKVNVLVTGVQVRI